MNARDILLVALGGAFGAVGRHLSTVVWSQIMGDRFPWGTLFVNVLGCLLLGWLVRTATVSESVSDSMKLVIGTGFLGAFTTFSTFGVQTVQLWQRSPVAAFGNVACNLLVGIAAVSLGMYLAAYTSAAE